MKVIYRENLNNVRNLEEKLISENERAKISQSIDERDVAAFSDDEPQQDVALPLDQPKPNK